MPPPVNPYAKKEMTAAQSINAILTAMKLGKQAKSVQYRLDYQDYFVVMEDGSRCALRETTVHGYQETKNADLRREMEVRLKAAKVPEDWEDDRAVQKKPANDIVIESE